MSSAAWADEGFVDCSSHPKATEIFSKSRETTDAIGAIPCGERFTILAYGFIFTRVETKDGKVGYVYSNLISIERSGTASATSTSITSPAVTSNVQEAATTAVQPNPATNTQPQPAAQGPSGADGAVQFPRTGERPSPLITGVFSFQSEFEPGTQTLSPEFDPIVLIPIGSKVLFESEFAMGTDVTRDHGVWGPAVVDHGVEYVQLNFIVHPNLTITAGRFLTPFGIYRERIHPMWVRKLPAEPIIFPMNDNSSNGGMLRGSARLTSGVQVTYAGYYSVLSGKDKLLLGHINGTELTVPGVSADRRAGARASLFLPNKRLELGVSFSRVLSDTRYNMVGGDVTWNLKWVPLDLRAEGIYSKILGSGYWIEAAYRLNKLSTNPLLRNSELVVRGEQYRLPDVPQTVIMDVPDQNTTRGTIGWNYYLHNGIRFDASYGRNFAVGENSHTWTVGLTYRFAFF